jgi:hypothetical protein
MQAILFLAMQGAMPTPLPAEMGPIIEPYSECVFAAFSERTVAAEGAGKLEQSSGPDLMTNAITDCARQREKGIEASELALANNPQFFDATARARFVKERFAYLDQTLIWSVSPEGDPDNWE